MYSDGSGREETIAGFQGVQELSGLPGYHRDRVPFFLWGSSPVRPLRDEDNAIVQPVIDEPHIAGSNVQTSDGFVLRERSCLQEKKRSIVLVEKVQLLTGWIVIERLGVVCLHRRAAWSSGEVLYIVGQQRVGSIAGFLPET